MNLTGNRCQCPTCGHYFNSVTGFDRHLVYNYSDTAHPLKCLSVPEMEATGFPRSATGWWITKRRSGMATAA